MKIRAHRATQGIGLFRLGLEIYRYEDEAHFVWGSQTIRAGRVFVLMLGLWDVVLSGADS